MHSSAAADAGERRDVTAPVALEFMYWRKHPIVPTPTVEDLIVFYYPSKSAWQEACGRMRAAGLKSVAAFNPYWSMLGRSYVDLDGYRVVLQTHPSILEECAPAAALGAGSGHGHMALWKGSDGANANWC